MYELRACRQAAGGRQREDGVGWGLASMLGQKLDALRDIQQTKASGPDGRPRDNQGSRDRERQRMWRRRQEACAMPRPDAAARCVGLAPRLSAPPHMAPRHAPRAASARSVPCGRPALAAAAGLVGTAVGPVSPAGPKACVHERAAHIARVPYMLKRTRTGRRAGARRGAGGGGGEGGEGSEGGEGGGGREGARGAARMAQPNVAQLTWPTGAATPPASAHGMSGALPCAAQRRGGSQRRHARPPSMQTQPNATKRRYINEGRGHRPQHQRPGRRRWRRNADAGRLAHLTHRRTQPARRRHVHVPSAAADARRGTSAWAAAGDGVS